MRGEQAGDEIDLGRVAGRVRWWRGQPFFVGRAGQWADDVNAVRDALLAFIKATLALYSDPIVGQSGRRAATPSTIAAK